MNRDRWADFWALLCGFDRVLRLILILLVIFLLLTLLSLAYVERGTGTYLIVLYNLTLFGGGLIAVVAILRKCSSRGVQR